MGGTICLAVRKAPKFMARSASAVFLVTALVGGAVTGGVAAVAGDIIIALPLGQMALVLAVCGTVGLTLLSGIGVSVWRSPSPPRQVSSVVSGRHSLVRTAGQWGLELGLGVATRANGWALWAVVALIMLINNLVGGLVVGAVYGGMRGSQVLVAFLWQTADLHRLTTKVQALESRLAPLVMFATIAGLSVALWVTG